MYRIYIDEHIINEWLSRNICDVIPDLAGLDLYLSPGKANLPIDIGRDALAQVAEDCRYEISEIRKRMPPRPMEHLDEAVRDGHVAPVSDEGVAFAHCNALASAYEGLLRQCANALADMPEIARPARP